MKKDQYDHPVPNDLVVLPCIETLHKKDIIKIEQAIWYECEEKPWVIMASAQEIDYLSEVDPIDCDIDIENCTVMQINDCLKRYSEEDGFYHA